MQRGGLLGFEVLRVVERMIADMPHLQYLKVPFLPKVFKPFPNHTRK